MPQSINRVSVGPGAVKPLPVPKSTKVTKYKVITIMVTTHFTSAGRKRGTGTFPVYRQTFKSDPLHEVF